MVLCLKKAGFLCNVSEGSIAIIVIQHVLTIIGNEQIQEAVVVIVSYTDTLAPTRSEQTCAYRNIGESSIVVVAIQVIRRFLVLGKTTQSPAINEENIQPSIIVVVEERHSTTSSGQKKTFL